MNKHEVFAIRARAQKRRTQAASVNLIRNSSVSAKLTTTVSMLRTCDQNRFVVTTYQQVRSQRHLSRAPGG